MSNEPGLFIATRNPNKHKEFEQIFGRIFPQDWQLTDYNQWPETLEDVIEDAETFEGNAIKKALETSLATNMSTLSEDSGLVVDALNGQPGVYSARFAGENANDDDNNKLLVKQLRKTPQTEYSATFVAVICLVLCRDAVGEFVLEKMNKPWHLLLNGFPMKEGDVRLHQDRAIFWLRGELHGEIVLDPRGKDGFGYDPHFLLPTGQTLAQLHNKEKSQLSHRARALEKLGKYLKVD